MAVMLSCGIMFIGCWEGLHLTLPYLTFGVNTLKDRLLGAEAILMLAQCASLM